MATSLKEFGRPLSAVIGSTIGAIYERQRELQYAGLIETPGTRGPGGGVRATPESVALLLCAILGSETKAESVEAARALYVLRPTGPSQTTGMKPFGEALAQILDDQELARRTQSVVIFRRPFAAFISVDPRQGPGSPATIYLGREDGTAQDDPRDSEGFLVKLELGRKALLELALALKA